MPSIFIWPFRSNIEVVQSICLVRIRFFSIHFYVHTFVHCRNYYRPYSDPYRLSSAPQFHIKTLSLILFSINIKSYLSPKRCPSRRRTHKKIWRHIRITGALQQEDNTIYPILDAVCSMNNGNSKKRKNYTSTINEKKKNSCITLCQD